jgi:hypothetical protein
MNSFERQTGIFDPRQFSQVQVNVIGVGSVGSFLTLSLAKLGLTNFRVFDPDRVEDHNLPNQFYRGSDLGEYKVNALQEIVWQFAGVEPEVNPIPYEGKERLSGLVIVAVDSMEVRKALWLHIRRQPTVEFLLDLRMGGEVASLFAIRPDRDRDFYEQTLHSSAEAFHARCTEASIIYCVLGIACFGAGLVKKYLTGQPYPRELTVDFKLGILIKNEGR